MRRWHGKFVIGLTGNIGTGKSVVRRMLEHLGAYGIDADALAHRIVAKGAPGYDAVVQMFGKWILGSDGEIDRVKLGRMVFGVPTALAQLEKITHPYVLQAIDYFIQRSNHHVVVIEAIKLMESGLEKHCHSLWAVYAPPDVQLKRLMQNRKMTESDARQRIASQPPQEQKISAAQVVIRNIGTFEDTWRQVVTAWKKFIPTISSEAPTSPLAPATPKELYVVRAGPRNSTEIANLMNRLVQPLPPLTREDIMAKFGEQAFMLLQIGNKMVGVLGWQVENLVARTTDILLDPSIPVAQGLPELINEMEQASRDLQCEASLVFAPPELARQDGLWRTLGYEQRLPGRLGVIAWQEAALESMQPNTVLYFKLLRQDRVLRPI